MIIGGLLAFYIQSIGKGNVKYCYLFLVTLLNNYLPMEFTTSLFLRNFDFYSLGTLSQVEFLAFTGLLLNWYILNYTISIILIQYRLYLIKRFNLEIRYPKIDKLIQLRRKLQNYYLKVCFVMIFIGIL